MDFVDWCGAVLSQLLELFRSNPTLRSIGVDETTLVNAMFGDNAMDTPGFRGSSRHEAVIQAVAGLEAAGLVADRGLGPFVQPTQTARELAGDLTAVWEHICASKLDPEEEELLKLVNRLSPRGGESYAWLEDISHRALLSELTWPQGLELVWPVAEDLSKRGFIGALFTFGPNITVSATYRGLVWETKRGFTLESRRIDALVAEGETTSVDLKRELHLDTADQKAEFIKDALALANTQASGPRLLLIGFDDKARTNFGPPDPRVTSNRIEQILARYTEPVIEVRYSVIDYRSGAVGQVQVLRDPRQLPYQVKQSIGEKKRIEAGDVFVRHGTQVEHPRPVSWRLSKQRVTARGEPEPIKSRWRHSRRRRTGAA